MCSSYKKTKESKTKESKPKESKTHTMYDKPIGPVKPVVVPKPEKKPQSYYKNMIDKVLTEHVEPKPKVTKPHTMHDKPVGPVKPKKQNLILCTINL